MDETAMLKEVLGDYGLTPAIASAVKLIFKNPYKSLLIVDQDARIRSALAIGSICHSGRSFCIWSVP